MNPFLRGVVLNCGLPSGIGEEEDGPVVESGEGEPEPNNYWKRKEAFLKGSRMTLGEKCSSGIF